MIGFDTENELPSHWDKFWDSVIKGDALAGSGSATTMELLNKALEKYHGTLTSHPTRQYRIITFEHEKDYLYYLMEWELT